MKISKSFFALLFLLFCFSFSKAQRLGNGGNLEARHWQRLFSLLHSQLEQSIFSESKEDVRLALKGKIEKYDLDAEKFVNLKGKVILLSSQIENTSCLVLSSQFALKVISQGGFDPNLKEFFIYSKQTSSEVKDLIKSDLEQAIREKLISEYCEI